MESSQSPLTASISAQPPSTVTMLSICPACHIAVKPTDYYCYNCGKNLKPKPASTSWITQLSLYVGSIILPPMGIIWGIRYLREKESNAKIIGMICIILTVVVLVVAIQATINLVNYVNNQVNIQTQNLMGL